MSTATAAMPPAMTAQMEPLAAAGAHAARRAPGRAAVAGLAVRTHDDVLRAVRAVHARRDHRRAGLGGGSRVREIRPRVLLHRRLGPGEDELRRAGADLRHARHLDDRPADRRAGQLRHRDLSHRDVPRRPQASARHRGRAAGGDPVDHLRDVGAVRVRAGVRGLRPAGAHQGLRRPVDPRPAVPGRAQRHRRALGGHHPVHHGDSVHRLGDARRVRDRAAGAQGIGLRHRRDDVGGGLERRAALHQGRRHRRHHARPRPGAGRDDGGDVRHRQRVPDQRVAVRARQLDRLGAGQRVQRGGRAGAPGLADRAGPRAVPAHRSSCSPARACCWRSSPRGRAGRHDAPSTASGCSSTG